ncbi:hypothetical protein [Aquabacterium sp.]|uniref:hypothetical protein n=1 Tax=Aquabacterium sp. TaxID=1872578 RepID=UPI0035B1EA94
MSIHHHHRESADAPAEPPFPITSIVDTNVILVANGQHPAVTQACRACCIAWLQRIMKEGRVALDDAYLIMTEYQHKTHTSTGDGVGDQFVRWVLHEFDNPARVDQVRIDPDEWKGFAAFPADQRLVSFDPSDRKFVAVSRCHPERPPILQAADSKWLDWSGPLAEYGVNILFLCGNELQQFHQHKFGI